MSDIGILGAGTWGIALARMLANSGHKVTVWSAIESEIVTLKTLGVHPKLPGVKLPSSIEYSTNISDACVKCEFIIFAVPSVFLRQTVSDASNYLTNDQIVITVVKGIETQTNFTMSEVISDELSKKSTLDYNIVALSGPTHAEEVALDIPTTIVAACNDLSIANKVQDVFMNTCMRVYTNPDIKGVELCGALKNIIALAAGMLKGLGYGDNTLAALITRGISEIARLGVAIGGYEQTFYGLAGIGDLIVTATSNHSRNNQCGYYIGKGYSVKEAVKKVGMVVEGLNALPAAIDLMKKHEIDMPITNAVNSVINENADPAEMVQELMTREKKSELCRSLLDINFKNTIIESKRGMTMKRVITYGTFDMLHYGHINLLKRAKALGDYLIVCLSTDEFNWNSKQKKCYFTYEQRKALLESIRYVDLVIPEENWEQKAKDVHEYHIDTFVIGDDWKGKFDFLKDEGVDVVYLPRTPEISTTQIKNDLHDNK